MYDANLPYNGVAIHCYGIGDWPKGAAETLKVPVTVPSTTAPGQFSCWVRFMDLVTSCTGDAFVTVPVSQTCSAPPPPAGPSVTKKVTDEVDWAFGLYAGSTNHPSLQNSLVCYVITWEGAEGGISSVADQLPSDLVVESCTPDPSRNYYCSLNRAAGSVTVRLSDFQNGVTPTSGKVTICGKFTKTHPAAGVDNVAVLTAHDGTRHTSNIATVSVEPVTPEITPPQISPTSDETPAASPTTIHAQVMRALAPGTTSTPSFAWLSSDIDEVPAALGPTFTKTFPKPGQYTVTELATANGFTSFRDIPVTVTASAAACTPNTSTLCLGTGGRFRVQVDWQDLPNQHTGVANAQSITADTGAFWFFDSSNLELVVKVLDGTALNHSFWVFYGALSNVQYEIKITDTHTGIVRTYTNPQGKQASAADTVAFASGSAADSATAVVPPTRGDEDLAFGPESLTSPSLACTTGGNNLCLDGRFQVSVAWNDVPNHHSGSGTPVSLTSNSGYMWFFSSSNVELILKIVDGRGLNGHFWFFYGALSNVQYTITVTDTQTGARKTYSNPQGTQASQADTSAF